MFKILSMKQRINNLYTLVMALVRNLTQGGCEVLLRESPRLFLDDNFSYLFILTRLDYHILLMM